LLTNDLLLHSVDGPLSRCCQLEVRLLECWVSSSGSCGESVSVLLLDALELCFQPLNLLFLFLLLLAAALQTCYL
jgi:hypothetical protein